MDYQCKCGVPCQLAAVLASWAANCMQPPRAWSTWLQKGTKTHHAFQLCLLGSKKLWSWSHVVVQNRICKSVTGALLLRKAGPGA